MCWNEQLIIIGKNIRFYRESVNLSCKDFSKILEVIGLNMNIKKLNDIELGKRNITVTELANISICLGVSMDDLFEEKCVFGQRIF